MASENYSTPTTLNYQGADKFQITLNRAKVTTFYLQRAKLPNIVLATTEISTPLGVNDKRPGNKLEYTPLSVVFKIDEDWVNFLEIHDWIRAIGAPESYDEYRRIASTHATEDQGIFSEISIIVLTSKFTPTLKFDFHDCFPTFIGINPDLERTTETNPYVEAVASFEYTYYDITRMREIS